MAFVRSGYVNITIGQAGIIGGNVYVRSRTASKDTNAYILASAISMVCSFLWFPPPLPLPR